MSTVLYHYCPPETEIDLECDTPQCCDEDGRCLNGAFGLWLSTKGQPDSWDTWRAQVDPRDEPLAEDLKMLYQVTLKETANIFDAGDDEYDSEELYDNYDGVRSTRDGFLGICIWCTDCIESVKELPSPFLSKETNDDDQSEREV